MEKNGTQVTVYDSSGAFSGAVRDAMSGLANHRFWWTHARQDIIQRFRRSIIGPFWITLSMAAFIAGLGLVMSQVFGQELATYIPYLTVGFIYWSLLTSTLTESCSAFIGASAFIRNTPIEISSHLYRVVARNFIIFLHNKLIFVIVILIFSVSIDINVLLFIPALLLILSISMIWGFIFAIVSTRYRDIPQILTSLLQVIFFMTPIFWSVEALPQRPVFVEFNPFYHLIQMIRAPLLGGEIDPLNWIVSGGIFVFGLCLFFLFYWIAHRRIAYWV